MTADNLGALFPVGQEIEDDASGTTGTIVKRNLDLGQLVIKQHQELNLLRGEQLRYTDINGVIQTLQLLVKPNNIMQYIIMKIPVVNKLMLTHLI